MKTNQDDFNISGELKNLENARKYAQVIEESYKKLCAVYPAANESLGYDKFYCFHLRHLSMIELIQCEIEDYRDRRR